MMMMVSCEIYISVMAHSMKITKCGWRVRNMMEHGQLQTKPSKQKDKLKWTRHFLDTNKSTTPSTANTSSITSYLLQQSLALVQDANPAGFIAKRVARFLLWEKLEPLLAEVGVPAGAKDAAAVATKAAAKDAAVVPVAARQYNIYNI